MPTLVDSTAIKDPSLQDADLLPGLPGSLWTLGPEPFLDYYTEADNNVSQILKERAAV